MSALEQVEFTKPTRRTRLHSVPAVKSSRMWVKATFPVLILSLLAVGMVGQLMLQTLIQEKGFELAALQSEIEQLSAQEALWRANLEKQSTPTQLAWNASQLGMVANPHANVLVLSTGEVIGSGKATKGDEIPLISAAPSLPQRTTPNTTEPSQGGHA